MIVYNTVSTVANLCTGEIALIVTPQHNGRPAQAQACTVEAVYRDAPGWAVDYRYTVAGGAVLYGTAYYHHGDDLIDVISVREEEPAASEEAVEPVSQTTSEQIAEGISEPCATCGAAAGDYCADDCVWVVAGYGDPNT